MKHGSFMKVGGVMAALAGAGAFAAPASVLAAPPAPAAEHGEGGSTASQLARLESELARVQQELREQRALIFQVMEMHSALLRYLQSGSSGAAGGMALPGGPSGTSLPSAAAAAGTPPGTRAAATNPAAEHAPATSGTLSGTVRIKNGALGDAFVYVDGPKVLAPRARALEIKQHNKQFSPSVAVVQVGTRVLFPNEDKVFHNVFSPTPGSAFNLGTLKAGDRPNPIALTKPGHVEVFCNIHSSMRADVLVVPNGHWTRVRPDGTFQISGVPFGQRQVILWGPGLKPEALKVELNATGAVANFATETAPRSRHLNKTGAEYGSYED